MKDAKQLNKYEPKETLAEINTFPFMEMSERKISKATCERFGVRTAVDPKDGKTPVAHYFPSRDNKNKISGYMKRDLTKTKGEDGAWSAIGTVSIGNKLFGQDVAEGIQRKRTNLIVTEGAYDAMSVFEAIKDDIAGTKWADLEPFVVSIPLGTKNAAEAMLHQKSFVNDFTACSLFFDNDECTPAELRKKEMRGKEAREAVAGAFIGEKVQMFTIEAAGEHKDASDYKQAGQSKELSNLAQFGRKPYSTEKVIKFSDISLDEILAPLPAGVQIPEFPGLMEKTGGPRTGELIVVTAPSGVGKTTFVSKLQEYMLKASRRCGNIYLEERCKETAQRAIAARLKVNFLKFKRDPLSVASREEIARVREELIAEDNVVLLDHFGSIPINDLMNKIKHMHFIEGCDFIILDHISMAVASQDVVDERKELDVVMSALASFCASHDCGIIVVCHINRQNASQFLPPKGKEDEPFWVRVTKESLRGSAALEQNAWVIIGLEPEVMPDRSRGRVRSVILKNRPWAFLGIADVFKLDDTSWEVILSSEEDSF